MTRVRHKGRASKEVLTHGTFPLDVTRSHRMAVSFPFVSARY
jgi:hypothetical protein